MTLTTEVSKVVLAGNGLTRDWDYTFPVFDNANYLKVYLTDPDGLTYLIEENYTVDLINSFVTYPTVISGLPLLPSGWKITIARELPEIQTSNYTTDGKFAAKAIENNLDKLTAMVQQQSEEIDRCVKVSIDNIGSGDQSDYLNKIIEARDETEVFRDEAEFFKDEAETAKINAETAKTNAETAETNAETAETNAETAETNAEGYANDALYYLNTATGISDWIDTKTYTKNMMCMHNDVVYYALDVAGNLNKEPPNITYWVSNYPVVLNDLEIKNLLISKPDSHFKYIDVDFQVGERYRSVWGDGTFVYVTCFGDGLRSYSVDGAGNLTYIDVDFQAGNDYSGVWGDGNFIYVACGFSGLRSYSVDGAGNLTYIDVDYQSSSYNNVWGDGNFIYVACGDGLRSYSVDGVGNLTYIDVDFQAGSDYSGVWGDGNFIYVACRLSGLRSYSVDGVGNLTYIDVDHQAGIEYFNVWGDGNFIYVACGNSGLRSYSVDGVGNLTYIDVDFQSGAAYGDVWGDGTFVYVTCFGDGLRSYSVDGVGNLTYIDVDFQAGNDYSGVWGDGNFIYVACGFSGLRSYSYSYNTPDGTVRFDPTLEKLQLVVDNAWDNIITNRALLDEGYSRSYNYFDNGAMEINQRAVEYAFLKNVWAFPVDRWDCMAIGTTVVSGTLKQINSTMGNLGKSIKFENLTITGAGEEYLRERIAGQYAIALKNKKVSIQCKIKHDIGNAIDFTIYLRKATSYNDFTIVTNITNSGAISVPSDVETLIKFENIDLGDCSNGLEFELKCESGEITNKNFEFTEFKLEIGEKITPFVAKDYASEILNCQKYYERVLVSFAGRSASLYSGNDRAMGGNINYSSTKIKIPYLYENEDYLDRIVYYGGGIANWTPGNIDDFNVNVIKNNLTGFIWERTGSGTSLYEHVKIDFEMIADSEYTLE